MYIKLYLSNFIRYCIVLYFTMIYKIIYCYFNIQTNLQLWIQRNPYLSAVQHLYKKIYDYIKNTVYEIPPKIPPGVKWCNTIAIYPIHYYKRVEFRLMGAFLKETYNIYPLIYPFCFLFCHAYHLITSPYAKMWGMLQNLYFFEKGVDKTAHNPVAQLTHEFHRSSVPRSQNNKTYHSVTESELDHAEKSIIEMKNSPIFKEKNEPTMKYMLFLLKTENFYYSKLIYQTSKMRNVDIPINYKISNVTFMTIEYVTPSLKTPLLIDLSSFKFAVGSNILNYTFIYWYLYNQYGNWVETVFDSNYKIHIIDNEFNIVELLPFNYLYLKENEYEVCQIYSLI